MENEATQSKLAYLANFQTNNQSNEILDITKLEFSPGQNTNEFSTMDNTSKEIEIQECQKRLKRKYKSVPKERNIKNKDNLTTPKKRRLSVNISKKNININNSPKTESQKIGIFIYEENSLNDSVLSINNINNNINNDINNELNNSDINNENEETNDGASRNSGSTNDTLVSNDQGSSSDEPRINQHDTEYQVNGFVDISGFQ